MVTDFKLEDWERPGTGPVASVGPPRRGKVGLGAYYHDYHFPASTNHDTGFIQAQPTQSDHATQASLPVLAGSNCPALPPSRTTASLPCQPGNGHIASHGGLVRLLAPADFFYTTIFMSYPEL